MKKLMFAAAACALAGVAQAAWSSVGGPTVYDYKASVKHMYLKEVKVTVNRVQYTVYQKYQKSASLKGYLIMDNNAVTSPTIAGVAASTGVGVAGTAMGYDFGRNRGFLVVQNSSAEAALRSPKILPAVMDAKWLDTAFAKGHTATSGIAEGYLFAGGDFIAPVREKVDEINGVYTGRAPAVPPTATVNAGIVAYSDYVWTSVYLFGQFNGPNWFFDRATTIPPFDNFEAAWDAALPATLRRGYAVATGMNYYHDTWLNGSGIGKWTKKLNKAAQCCGIIDAGDPDAPVLESLSGNLKGGIFLCTENGIDAKSNVYQFFDAPTYANYPRGGWEDQFVEGRLVGAECVTFADSWMNDLWQDGSVENETTDVAYGTWSIKLNQKFMAANGGFWRDLTVPEINAVMGNPNPAIAGNEGVAGIGTLCAAIKGAALKLKANAVFCDGTEIYARPANNRFNNLPLITPQFATFYGLANWN